MVRGLDPELLQTVVFECSAKINQLNLDAARRMGDITAVHADMLQRHEDERQAWSTTALAYKQTVYDEAREEVDRIIFDTNQRSEARKKQVTEHAEQCLQTQRTEVELRLCAATRRTP